MHMHRAVPFPIYLLPLELFMAAALFVVLFRGIRHGYIRSGVAPEAALFKTSIFLSVTAAWGVVVGWLGLIGLFHATTASIALLPVTFIVPIVVTFTWMRLDESFAAALRAIEGDRWVRVQWLRSFGFVFLFMLASGVLPAVFALPAGIGDMITGVAALGIASRLQRGPGRDLQAAVLWNAFGILDFAVAIGTGVLTSPGPTQLLSRDHPNFAVTTFPLVLVPTFFVPVFFILHILSLQQLGREKSLNRGSAGGVVSST